ERASEEEEKDLFNWIKASKQNEETFAEAKKLWNKVPAAEELSPEVEKSWNQLKKRIEKDEARKLKPAVKVWYMAAASVLLLLGILFFAKLGTQEISGTELATKDKMDVYYLPDSSIIFLNKNSRLRYGQEFGNTARTVTLEGEAFFDVRSDASRPFIIFAGESRTLVTGTSFDINAYQSDVEVIVATGLVRFSTVKDSVGLELKPGQKGTLHKKDLAVTAEKNNNPAYVEWKERLEDLKKTRLYEKEAAAPSQFLVNHFTWRENLLKQTVIEGEIESKAVLATYSNIKLKATYTQAGKSIKTNFFKIDILVKPGKTIVYSYKLNDWFKNTTGLKIEIVNADVKE
ncbi:MAG: FecR family protein, partial [Cytophagaceae bacterium]